MNPHQQELCTIPSDATVAASQFLFDHLNIGVILIDTDAKIQLWNRWMERRSGIAKESACHNNLTTVFPEITDSRIEETLQHSFQFGLPAVVSNVFNRSPLPLFHLTKQGALTESRIEQELHILPIKQSDEIAYCMVQINDVSTAVQRQQILEKQITDRKKVESALAQERNLFIAGPTVIFKWLATDGWPIEYVSPNISEQFGLNPAELLSGQLPYQNLIHPDDLDSFVEQTQHALQVGSDSFTREYRLQTPNRGYRWVSDHINLLKQSDGTISHLHGYVLDISVRKEFEAHVKHLAYHDPLTNLPNRRMLRELLESEISRSQRSEKYGAIIYLDLDRFKPINDSLGHIIGDMLLQEVAARLQQSIRLEDYAARMGGDEFVVLLPQIHTDLERATRTVQRIAKKIIQQFSKPFLLNHNHVQTTPSLGITLFSNQDFSTDELLQQADSAMYKVKTSGRNNFQIFSQQDHQADNLTISLENDLHKALLRDQFVLYFQPQINDKQQLFGVEALLRWQHPEHGILLPERFMSLLENNGLIIPVSYWVLQQVCQQLQQWQESDGLATPPKISINISPRQFYQSDFIQTVKTLLHKHSITAGALEFDISEETIINDIEDAIEKLSQLQAIGIRISLDDFGSGYSFLAHLQRLPIQVFKIDQHLLQNELTSHNDEVIIDLIITIANRLNKQVVAEGVETVEQLQLLQAKGCHAYQGYHFSRPLSTTQLQQFLLDGDFPAILHSPLPLQEVKE